MTIPASQIVTVNPSVLAAGGNPLALNGLFLTQNTQMPTGTVLGFVSAQAVSNFFGPASAEYAAALIYFAGYNNSTIKPTAMLFAAYNVAARSAFLQSGNLAGVPLATLQGYSGTLTITIAGTPLTSSNIVLTGLSYSAMAAAIEAAFTDPGFTVAWNAVNSTFVFTSTVTGASETIAFASGSLAADLFLTSATGAILSQGANIDTPSSAMANAVAVSQNWVSMVTLFEPDLAHKELFAAWFSAQDDAYLYLAWALNQAANASFAARLGSKSVTMLTQFCDTATALFIALEGVSTFAPCERIAPVALVRNKSAASEPDAKRMVSDAPVAVLVKTKVLFTAFQATVKPGLVKAASMAAAIAE